MISIPPGSAKAIEAVFPEEGTYVGNDNDMGRFISGAGFVIVQLITLLHKIILKERISQQLILVLIISKTVIIIMMIQ